MPIDFILSSRSRRRTRDEASTSSGVSSSSSADAGERWLTCDVRRHVTQNFQSVAPPTVGRRMREPEPKARTQTPSSMDPPHTNTAPFSSPNLPRPPCKVKLMFKVGSQSDRAALQQIYEPFVDIVTPGRELCEFVMDENMGTLSMGRSRGKWRQKGQAAANQCSPMPPLGLVLLMQEEDSDNFSRVRCASQYLRVPPFAFHHSERPQVSERIQACPDNSQDYFAIAEELPLCAVRQVPGAQEHTRLLRYVQHEHWQQSRQLYGLLLGQTPDFDKPDFCIFTVASDKTRTVQFALKCLPYGVRVLRTAHSSLGFRVRDVSRLMPLLPAGCLRISKRFWQTRDPDGNDIFLEVARQTHTGPLKRPKSCDSPLRKSNVCKDAANPCSTGSFASILLDTAREFIDADESLSTSDTDFSPNYDSDSGSLEHSVNGTKLSGIHSLTLPHKTSHTPHDKTKALLGVQAHTMHVVYGTRSHKHSDSGFADDCKSDDGASAEPGNDSFFGKSILSLAELSDLVTAQYLNSLMTQADRESLPPSVQQGHTDSSLLKVGTSTNGAFKPYVSNKPRNGLHKVGILPGSDVRNIRATSDTGDRPSGCDALEPGSPHSHQFESTLSAPRTKHKSLDAFRPPEKSSPPHIAPAQEKKQEKMNFTHSTPAPSHISASDHNVPTSCTSDSFEEAAIDCPHEGKISGNFPENRLASTESNCLPNSKHLATAPSISHKRHSSGVKEARTSIRLSNSNDLGHHCRGYSCTENHFEQSLNHDFSPKRPTESKTLSQSTNPPRQAEARHRPQPTKSVTFAADCLDVEKTADSKRPTDTRSGDHCAQRDGGFWI